MENKFSFEQFETLMLNTLNTMLENEKKVLGLHKVQKNNDTALDAIVIIEPETEVSPAIYMQQLFEDYASGVGIKEIAEHVVLFYKQDYQPDDFGLTEIMNDFNLAKDKVILKLVNQSQNQELLKNVPYVEILDLAAIFQILVKNPNGEIGSTTVTKDLFDRWNVTKEALYGLALNNTKTLCGVCIEDMSSVLLRMAAGDPELEAELQGCPTPGNNALYVMTNNMGHNGATTILFEDIKDFAEQIDSDLFIVPSSIHEVLLIPEEAIGNKQLTGILQSVNATELAPQDILSDHLYFYSRETEQVMSA